MQMMCETLCVLGSRHGLIFDPVNRCCKIVRFDRFESCTNFQLRAGAVIDGQEFVFPFCASGQGFDLLDMRITPCTVSFIGVHAGSATRCRLTFVTPFRPRDAAFSTTPVIGIRLGIAPLGGNFRWTAPAIKAETAQLFLELGGIALEKTAGNAGDIFFSSTAARRARPDEKNEPAREALPQHDRIVTSNGTFDGRRFARTVRVADPRANTLDAAWCAYSPPVLLVKGKRLPFRYTLQFAGLDAVGAWAQENIGALFENAARVDGIVGRNTLSRSANNLLAQTLHSFQLNSWWALREGGEWFTVWEGNCYFHSTVDVEFTQCPFYLAVWPELLKYELDIWTDYSKDGASVAGERARGTLFLSHDIGQDAEASGQAYHHEMEVEETTNYLIMLYAYWRRTGDAELVKSKKDIIAKYLAFLDACDSTGNHIPDKGVANTIDDGSPAIQYGREQVYLAVKTLAAFRVGAEMLRFNGLPGLAATYDAYAGEVCALIEQKGWNKDHYVVLLDKSGKGIVNPWDGKPLGSDIVPGWDRPHIYTANALAPLDMVGFDVGLSAGRLRTDLAVAAERCLREYGCVHTDFANEQHSTDVRALEGLAGVALAPGWIAMNMVRDIAAFYRGVDLRSLADRYWAWQVLTNTQGPSFFFETFDGNNLHAYPRGVAIWGYFDAVAGLVIDKVGKVDKASRPLSQARVPRLFDADWKAGTCELIESFQ